ncbi:MAG: beta-lactamase family protein [Candidatus Hydrogenedentes bacterium]|nr:beta-lactamase family protein [Candidatus Hydrogenedentota bacterium]
METDRRRWFPVAVAACAWAACVSAAPEQPPAAGEVPQSTDLKSVLEPLREKHKLPALAAAVVSVERVIALGVVGERKEGSGVAAKHSDAFHLGSDTKAMTATLIGMLVDDGKLSWTTTLSEVFPELASSMQPEFQTVTVEQLLMHRAGLSGRSWPKGVSFDEMHALPGSLKEQRLWAATKMLQEKPEHTPGKDFEYSNGGYLIAGAVAERVTGESWETLMQTRIFAPLNMKTAGFGSMGAPGTIDQPWQHRTTHLLGQYTSRKAIEPGPRSDNPPAMGPAGTVHCSLEDWASFVRAHLDTTQEHFHLVKPETLAKLHMPPPGGDYALGWLVTPRDWGGGNVLTHAGSNTQNFAVVWVAPLKDFAVLVATNHYDDNGNTARACDEVAATLIGQFLLNKEGKT